mgnify:CR=1 FL=1
MKSKVSPKIVIMVKNTNFGLIKSKIEIIANFLRKESSEIAANNPGNSIL